MEEQYRTPSSLTDDDFIFALAYATAKFRGIHLSFSSGFEAASSISSPLPQTSSWAIPALGQSSNELSQNISSTSLGQHTSQQIHCGSMYPVLYHMYSPAHQCTDFSSTQENNENENNLENDLDIVKEVRNNGTFSHRPSDKGSKKRNTCTRRITLWQEKKDLRSTSFWDKMHNFQAQWIEKVCTSTFSITAATSFANECWELLNQVYSMFRNRPLKLQESIQHYICEAIKFYEFLILRGCDIISDLLPKFIRAVFGRYLKKRKYMNELNQGWIQSREVMRIVCQTPTVVDVLLGLVAAIDEMMLTFMRSSTCDCIDRDMTFVSYAVEQMNDLMNRANQRIQHCQRRKDFALQF